MMRFLLLLLALPLLATFAPAGMIMEPVYPAAPTLWAEPVPLRTDAPGERRLGRLTFLAGWWLRSNHPRFGGISGMHVADGMVTALNDNGIVLRFAVPARTGAAPLTVLDLPAAPGATKKQRDSEALAIDGARAWVSFERANAIYRYRLPDWRGEASARPEALARWSLNSGGEAMLRLRDGRFLLFSEGGRRRDGSSDVVLFERDPAEASAAASLLRYRAPDGYRITDAAELPDGRLLFLNRRVSLMNGITAKLTLAKRPQLFAGATLSGTEVASFAAPVTTDNYEALSVGQERGRTIVWIASDDNFLALQRTMLMKFAMED